MPIYTFKCMHCNNTFEEFYHITEELPTLCPKCEVGTLQQVMGLNAHWFPHSCTFNGKIPLTDFQKHEQQLHRTTKYY